MKDKKSSSQIRPDLATLGGLLLGICGVMAGLLMEGGKVQDVTQVTAALIVFPATLGAVMVTTPAAVLARAFRKLPQIFFYRTGGEVAPVIEEILRYAAQARKEGIVTLERDADAAPDPFLRKSLSLAVDGVDLQQIRRIMDLEILSAEQHEEAEAKVFEAAGGYAPTIGIIGAIIGLIQVMKNLANIDEVGRGIAVAFVATIYGVASANMLFLPAANKLRARARGALLVKEVMLEGVISIVEGMHPKLIRSRLESYLEPAPARRKKPAKGARSAARPLEAES